jgi:hypothetical protein
MRCQLVDPTPENMLYIAQRMRAQDVAEIWASHHSTPLEALEHGAGHSSWVKVGVIDGEPVCMFGVSAMSLLYREGLPWMLGTDALNRHARLLVRIAPAVVAYMHALYPTLYNWVDARNRRSVKWLKALGFRLGDPAPYGADGLPFHRFSRSG